MQDVRSNTRKSLEEFVTSWLGGDEQALGPACSPEVRWWTPLDDETGAGTTAVWKALARVVAAVPRPIEVTALAVDEDGSRGIVEMRAGVGAPAGTTFVTSVIMLSDGKVVEGRTYADPAQPSGSHGEGP